MVVFKNFLIFLLSQQLHQDTPSSESNKAWKTAISNKKKEKYFPDSFISQASTLVSGQVQTNSVSFGWVSGFQVCLPLHSSPFSQLSCAREQGLWREGEEQAQTPELLGEGSPHLCSVTAVGLGLSKSRVSMGTRPHSTGSCFRSGSAVMGSAFACFVPFSIILVSVSAGAQASWRSAAGWPRVPPAGQGCGCRG